MCDNIRLYHADHLGSTSLVTDIDGEITQHVAYIPYGEVFVEQRNGSWNTPYLFNAKELDEETGLYYYGARYLDPTNAAWLSVDPLFEKYVGMTPYGYCAGNPVKLVDMEGRDIYVFDEEGNFSHIISDGTDKARGYLMKNESHDAILFDFADPVNDPSKIGKPKGFDKVQIITDDMIDNALWNASVYEPENQRARYMFALLQSSVQNVDCEKGINAKLDFYATANMEVERRHWMQIIEDPCEYNASFLSFSSNVLFLTKTTKGWHAHNDHNLGNFLWGAAMDALGFWEITARIGAHIQNRFLSNEQKAKKEWDSPDDQLSISLGYDWYNNYKKGK